MDRRLLFDSRGGLDLWFGLGGVNVAVPFELRLTLLLAVRVRPRLDRRHGSVRVSVFALPFAGGLYGRVDWFEIWRGRCVGLGGRRGLGDRFGLPYRVGPLIAALRT
ncbi:MAG: hypothetical protein ABR518_05250, partial [Actinomycetota bacterium]